MDTTRNVLFVMASCIGMDVGSVRIAQKKLSPTRMTTTVLLKVIQKTHSAEMTLRVIAYKIIDF